MKEVGSYEAKTHLPRLLKDVRKGEHISITKHGVPVAELRPPASQTTKKPEEIILALRAFRRGRFLHRGEIREMIEEGRK